MAQPLVRNATAEDRAAITAIYNHYVDAPVTFDVHPFTEAERAPWFAQFSDEGPHRLLVLEEDGQVCGYTGSMPFRAKPAYATSVETTIYLASGQSGRGRGPILYEALFEAIAHCDLRRALAGITLPNEPSVRLHERLGFRHAGTFTEVGRKNGRYWDVGWWERPLEKSVGDGP